MVLYRIKFFGIDIDIRFNIFLYFSILNVERPRCDRSRVGSARASRALESARAPRALERSRAPEHSGLGSARALRTRERPSTSSAWERSGVGSVRVLPSPQGARESRAPEHSRALRVLGSRERRSAPEHLRCSGAPDS